MNKTKADIYVTTTLQSTQIVGLIKNYFKMQINYVDRLDKCLKCKKRLFNTQLISLTYAVMCEL